MNGPKRPPAGELKGGAPRSLAPCPARPNCASTRQEGGVEPLPYTSRDRALERLRALLAALPRTRIVVDEADEGGYLRAEVRSRLFGFVDDLEILLDEAEKRIHLRSASRVGYSDLGVNRKRLLEIRRLFLAGGPV
ncbi:MAG TPA: DUF1499 domain-containing protein [Thermoanaerobaculia bacterium]|nr:DUF1499 domain-containing protein [Thermoanaerobaculia bacterium]